MIKNHGHNMSLCTKHNFVFAKEDECIHCAYPEPVTSHPVPPPSRPLPVQPEQRKPVGSVSPTSEEHLREVAVELTIALNGFCPVNADCEDAIAILRHFIGDIKAYELAKKQEAGRRKAQKEIAAFWTFMTENPDLEAAIVEYLRGLQESERMVYSTASIVEKARWHRKQVTKTDPQFRINDHIAQYLSRYLMMRYPEFIGMFEWRESVTNYPGQFTFNNETWDAFAIRNNLRPMREQELA